MHSKSLPLLALPLPLNFAQGMVNSWNSIFTQANFTLRLLDNISADFNPASILPIIHWGAVLPLTSIPTCLGNSLNCFFPEQKFSGLGFSRPHNLHPSAGLIRQTGNLTSTPKKRRRRVKSLVNMWEGCRCRHDIQPLGCVKSYEHGCDCDFLLFFCLAFSLICDQIQNLFVPYF